MPGIDMTAVLTNSYLLDVFNLIRQQETVGENGRNIITPVAKTGLMGVIVPEGSAMERKMNFTIQPKGIVVITTFALRGDASSNPSQFQPDIVVWHGDQFIVKTVMDYSAYGCGFIAATCELFNENTSQAPVTMPGGVNAQ